MSSSSDDEVIAPVIKRLKRRRRPIMGGETEKQKVNLYSHKILPKLDALAKSPIKISKVDKDEGNDYVPFDISPIRSPKRKKTSESSSPATSPKSGSDSSPIKVIPPTPPPPFNPGKKRRRGGRARKLINEVATVLSQVSKHETLHQDSIIATDDSFEMVKEIIVKVRFHGKLQKFPIEENKSFEEVFKDLAQKAHVDVARVLITFGDRRVFPSDTPIEIKLTIADILECVIAHRRLAPNVKDTIKIQMQGPFQKKKEPFTMGRTEPFLAVMEEYAQKYNTSINRLQFRFDGEPLKSDACPTELDMDNGDCVDVMHLKSL